MPSYHPYSQALKLSSYLFQTGILFKKLKFLGFSRYIYLFIYLYFLASSLEYNCSTMVCQLLLYNKVNQPYIYIYPHISSLLRLPPTLPIPPLQVVTKHRADLPVLCGCFPLAIDFSVDTFKPVHRPSQFLPCEIIKSNKYGNGICSDIIFLCL